MKYVFVFFFFFSIPLFTMEQLLRVTIPSTEYLIATLDDKYHSLAHRLGGKTLYPVEVLMIIRSFYNYEDDLSKKSKNFEKTYRL